MAYYIDLFSPKRIRLLRLPTAISLVLECVTRILQIASSPAIS
jgi:hypothetical protein